MSLMNMLEAIREAIGTAMSADDKVMVLGQDVGKLGNFCPRYGRASRQVWR